MYDRNWTTNVVWTTKDGIDMKLNKLMIENILQQETNLLNLKFVDPSLPLPKETSQSKVGGLAAFLSRPNTKLEKDKRQLGQTILDRVKFFCPKMEIKEIKDRITRIKEHSTDVYYRLSNQIYSPTDNTAFILVYYKDILMGIISFYFDDSYLLAIEQGEKLIGPYKYARFVGITKTITMQVSENCGIKFPKITSLLIPQIIKLAKELEIPYLGVLPLPNMARILEKHYGFSSKIEGNEVWFYDDEELYDTTGFLFYSVY